MALHPPPSTSALPNSEAVKSPSGRGGNGWMLRVNKTSPEVFIPFAPGTCASPLQDAGQLEFLAAPNEADFATPPDWDDIKPTTNIPSDGDFEAEFAWTGSLGIAGATAAATLRGADGGEISSEWFRSHPCGGNWAGSGLVCEEEVVRMLTLYRNQLFGAVNRIVGQFDVLSVTRGTLGIALDDRANMVAAWDITSSSASMKLPSLLMYTPRTGPKRPVHAGEAALLSLGRGIMADPSWLGDSFPGGVSSSIDTTLGLRGQPYQSIQWSLDDVAAKSNASRWLQQVAMVICQPPLTSFVVDEGLCAGVKTPPSSQRTAVTADGKPMASEMGLGAGRFADVLDAWAAWIVDVPESSTAPPCPPLDDVDLSLTLWQPIWLLGRMSRELHATGPGSEVEVELASRLTTCTFPTWNDREASSLALPRTDSLTAALSQTYRRDLFQQDPPLDPVLNTELLLAVLVVVPETVALLMLLVKRLPEPPQLRWSWRRMLVVTVALLAGGLALAAVGYIDIREREGDKWRAATVRLETNLPVNETELHDRHSEYGRLVTFSETLFVISRPGYRPVLTRRVLVATSTIYIVLALTLVVRVASAALRRPLPDHDIGAGDQGHSTEDGLGSMPPSRKFLCASRRWRRHSRRSSNSGRWWRTGAPPASDGPATSAGCTAADGADCANPGGDGGDALHTTRGQ
ncbi:hypothetical protein MMPV_003557 [Pyropia vietnamensis]